MRTIPRMNGRTKTYPALAFLFSRDAGRLVLSFNVLNHSSEETAQFLNTKGFALRAGLHCAPTAHKKIGTLSNGTVRFSPSVFNNENEVDILINNIKKYK